MKKILWLASWYPSKLHRFNGDFIQRHARAVSIYRQVHLIHVVKDEDGIITQNVCIERQSSGNLSEVIVYYRPMRMGVRFLDRALSLVKYVRVYKQVINSFIKEHGTPAIVHVHVAMWSGVLARWIQRKYGVNYFVTEHWSGYNRISVDNLYQKDFIFRRQAVAAIRNALMLLPVSRQLGNLVGTAIFPVPYQVVPNVVDTRFFTYSSPELKGKFRFIHVSTMDQNKGVGVIMHTFAKLLAFREDCELVLVGPMKTDLDIACEKLGLKAFVNWRGMVNYEQVASEMQQASALVMFSRYENQPCVILEAQCCGLPVIATAVGGIPEIVYPENGILVEPGNEQALLDAMIGMIDTYQQFNKPDISRKARALYGYETVGKKISDLYDATQENRSG